MELIAFVTTSRNNLGADAGISVEEAVTEDGILREHNEIARTADAGTLLDDGDALNEDAAEAMLLGLGYSLVSPFRESGGQWAAHVERA